MRKNSPVLEIYYENEAEDLKLQREKGDGSDGSRGRDEFQFGESGGQNLEEF